MTPMYAYMNGKIVPWQDAQVHVFSPVVRYATAVFESILGFWYDGNINLFRLDDHLHRLDYAQKMMRFTTPASDIKKGIVELISANNFQQDVIIRPMVYLDGESPGGSIGTTGPASLAITAFPKSDNILAKTGCSVQISSWIRIPDSSMPARIKTTANYHNGRLAEMQSKLDGYDSCLLMNNEGYVSEGPGQCFAMIRDGVLITPDIGSDILESITRDTLLQLANSNGMKVEQRKVTRSELYLADEAFFCGSTWAVTPITSIDRLPVASGVVGPVTTKLKELYRMATLGENPQWVTKIN